MRTARLHSLNNALVQEDIPMPEPGPGEVRVDVRACGVNFADTLMVKGQYQEKPDLPFAPGMEIAGVVSACGPDGAGPASRLETGTPVMALVPFGGFSEAAIAPTSACIPIPSDMPFTTAAGFMIAYGTSDLGLVERAKLRKGETLLVLGASGGVGLTAVEIGALVGANVIAVARGVEKLRTAHKHGAHHLIDSSSDGLRDQFKALGGVDVVYDPVGEPLFTEALRGTNQGARILPVGFAGGRVPQISANILLVKNLTVHGLYWGAYRTLDPATLRRSFERLLTWYSQKQLTPHISAEVPLDRAEDALELLRTRKATGKVVLTME